MSSPQFILYPNLFGWCFFWFLGQFFVFQSRVVFLAICSIGTKIFICSILEQKFLIACYLQQFGATISDLRTMCCVLELEAVMSHAICIISDLKWQIWVIKILSLNGNCNILVFTHFCMVFRDVWIVFIDFLIIFSDFSMVSIFFGFLLGSIRFRVSLRYLYAFFKVPLRVFLGVHLRFL